MVDSWNGLKKVSAGQQTSNTGAMPDLKQDQLQALGAVASLGCGFEGKFLWDFNFCSVKVPEGSCVTGACHEALSSAHRQCHLDSLEIPLELLASDG